MTDPQPAPWESWAPPLDPPDEGGLPRAEAQAIADAWWDCDPHMAAALMWEAYAATLPLEPQVTSVQTGVQSVTYGQPWAGPALAKAEWHRSLAGNLVSVPLRRPEPEVPAWPADWWQRNTEHPW